MFLGKIINHLLCNLINSHSEIRDANKSVTSVVRPVPGMLQAIHLHVKVVDEGEEAEMMQTN